MGVWNLSLFFPNYPSFVAIATRLYHHLFVPVMQQCGPVLRFRRHQRHEGSVVWLVIIMIADDNGPWRNTIVISQWHCLCRLMGFMYWCSYTDLEAYRSGVYHATVTGGVCNVIYRLSSEPTASKPGWRKHRTRKGSYSLPNLHHCFPQWGDLISIHLTRHRTVPEGLRKSYHQ